MSERRPYPIGASAEHDLEIRFPGPRHFQEIAQGKQMKFRNMLIVGAVVLESLFLTSCSQELATDDLSAEALASAIRAVGYSCDSVVSSTEMSDARTSWRVSCQGAAAYTANLSGSGTICVTPIAYADAPGPAGPVITPEETCIAASEI
jgi:outer membrane murein-binding lipoprotein Lpp